MAVYSNLPVFKASYDLVLEVFMMCKSLPKDYKYTVGERLKNQLTDLMSGIYEANLEEDKTLCLQQCRRNVVVAKLYVRLLYDMKVLSMKRYTSLSEKFEIISKQLNAWSKSVETKKAKKDE
jgi:hypothetical protein